MAEKLCITVGEIKAALRHLPDAMPVSFSPITSAWLGTSGPMRFGNEINFYTNEGESAAPYDPGARCSIFLFEDRTGEQE
jgi:hypothetical protein